MGPANDHQAQADMYAEFFRGLLDVDLFQIYKLWTSWFQRRGFLSFSDYKSIGGIDPRGVVNSGPRDLIGRIYVQDY